MDELTNEEIIILNRCEELGLTIEEATMMLLIFEDATKIQKKKILNKLLFVENKEELVDLFVDNTK